jgi:mono/diheme cytochrome c family protein
MAGALLMTSALLPSMTVAAQEVSIRTAGADEFRISCTVCHGEGGQGGGPLAKLLTVKPADLTKLSQRNSGRFPLDQMLQIIDGRTQVSGHGTREMPVWGSRYEAEIGKEYGPYGNEAIVRARILELTYYLQTIQK